MESLIKLAAAILPALLLLLYIWKKDPNKEPSSKLFSAFIWGIVIVIPIILVEQIISVLLFGPIGEPKTFTGYTIQSFLVAAVPEESFKLLALWLVLRKNPFFDEHFDGVVYAVFVGLGFAAVENIFYVLSQEQWLQTAIVRSLLAVPGHYAFAVTMGYFYSLYHFGNRSPKTAVSILFFPVLIHGIYDTLLSGDSIHPIVGYLLFFVLIYFCIKMHKKANKKIELLIEKDQPVDNITIPQ